MFETYFLCVNTDTQTLFAFQRMSIMLCFRVQTDPKLTSRATDNVFWDHKIFANLLLKTNNKRLKTCSETMLWWFLCWWCWWWSSLFAGRMLCRQCIELDVEVVELLTHFIQLDSIQDKRKPVVTTHVRNKHNLRNLPHHLFCTIALKPIVVRV